MGVDSIRRIDRADRDAARRYRVAMLALTLALAVLAPQQPTTAPHPDADNFREWLTFVQPSTDEEAYRTIGWRNALWPAVQEAQQLGRPILLWTMNGHPLGCT